MKDKYSYGILITVIFLMVSGSIFYYDTIDNNNVIGLESNDTVFSTFLDANFTTNSTEWVEVEGFFINVTCENTTLMIIIQTNILVEYTMAVCYIRYLVDNETTNYYYGFGRGPNHQVSLICVVPVSAGDHIITLEWKLEGTMQNIAMGLSYEYTGTYKQTGLVITVVEL